MSKTNRINELDILRGLAVIAMVIYHYFFILEYFQYGDYDMFHGWLNYTARFAQYSFLGLVGITLAISKKTTKQQWLRSLKLIPFAFMVTLATAIFAPAVYVKFGILHHIAVSIFLLAPISKKPKLALALGVIALILGDFLRSFASASWPLIFLGTGSKNFYALDHFAIFPWIGVTLIGIFIGGTFYKKKKGKINLEIPPLTLIGRHSLLVYMIHVPILLAITFAIFDK